MKIKTKKKKYSDAGPVLADISNLKVPALAKKLPNELAAGPKSPGSANAPDLSGVESSILDMGTSVLSSIGKSAIDNADPRSNPAIAMKKANTMNTASDLLAAAGKGAAVGGPWGAAAGLLTAGVGKIIGAKKQRADLAKAQTGWASDNLSSYQSAVTKSSYIKGGTIKGAGTGKSDSINMKAKNGSFIVPSENADYGRQLGEEYLGWKPKEKADKNKGGIDIKASNSEVIFNPEEVRILNYHGVNLDSLAPNANTTGENSSGGSININPANKGKFTATKKATGKSTGQLLHSPNAKTRSRANFARMAKRGFKALAEGGPIDLSNLTSGISKKNNALAPSPYKIEKAPDNPDATFNVSNPVYNALTYKNVIQKLTDSGVITPDNSGKVTTDTLTKMIDANPHLNLSYKQLKQGKTANPDNMGYYEKSNKPSGPEDSFSQTPTTKKFVKPNPYIGVNQRADGGPVVKTSEKASMTGALIHYMNRPKNTGASITTADANNVPISQKRRNSENMDKITNDPNNRNMIMAAGNMSGSISGMMNKMDVIESIVNSPKIAKLGKAAQDYFREAAPGMDKSTFSKLAEDAGHTAIGKYWTTVPSSVSKLYKKGGIVMKKKNMMKGLSTGIKGRKKMPALGDMNTPMMKKGGTISPDKAAEILHDGTANGKALTKKQRGFMAVHATGKAKYAPGGGVTDPITREAAISTAKIFKPKVSTFDMKNKPASTLVPLKPHSPTNPLPNIGFPEIAGAVQAAGGAYGLATAKKAPDMGVSETLKNLSADVRKQAAYGLDPSQLNVLNNSVERSRRDTNRMITEGGGSGQEVMSKLNTSLGTTIAGKESIAFQDAAEKARKFSNVINVDSQIAGQEFDVKRMRREDWYKNQEMFASLLSTGIENIIGARQFKEQQKTFRERDNSPVFSIKQ